MGFGLILKRKRYEAIMITTQRGDRVTVRVAEIAPNEVKIAVMASPDTIINRAEVQAREDEKAAVEALKRGARR